MNDWKTRFLLGRPIFSGYLSFREGNNPTFPHTNCEQKSNSKKNMRKKTTGMAALSQKHIHTSELRGKQHRNSTSFSPSNLGDLERAWDVNVCDLVSKPGLQSPPRICHYWGGPRKSLPTFIFHWYWLLKKHVKNI